MIACRCCSEEMGQKIDRHGMIIEENSTYMTEWHSFIGTLRGIPYF